MKEYKQSEKTRLRKRLQRAKWRQIPGNAEKNREACKKWAAIPENAERIRQRTRQWSKDNPERKKAGDADFRKNNKHLTAFYVKRYKQTKRRAAPVWRNDFMIEEAYRLASLRTELTGIVWHVDHVVPLQGRTVCGLHVEANLAVITGSENNVKGNRCWPNMA